MRPYLIWSICVPVLFAATAIAPQFPTQAQTVIYRNRIDRSHGYFDGDRSNLERRSRYEIEDSTLVNPVLVEPQIQDSTLINPVIVEPGYGYPSRSYPSRTIRRQSPASRNPSCVDFASLRVACR